MIPACPLESRVFLSFSSTCFEGLLGLPLGMLRGHRLHAIERKNELSVEWLLDP
jgi:hypothetical protein